MLRNRLKDPTLLAERAYINGQWLAADDGATLEVLDPATGQCIAHVPALQGAETRRAIEAAEAALPAWRERPAAQRALLLEAWYQAILDNLDDLALIMTLEQGKPLAEAQGEIRYAASFVKWFAEEARRQYGETIPSPSGDRRLLTLKQPVGVCAAITPWN
ncbi:aldehyde dehydrogenase family protein, partial [Pseudomonas sp.]